MVRTLYFHVEDIGSIHVKDKHSFPTSFCSLSIGKDDLDTFYLLARKNEIISNGLSLISNLILRGPFIDSLTSDEQNIYDYVLYLFPSGIHLFFFAFG